MADCPVCHQPLPDTLDFVLSLDTNSLHIGEQRIDLTPKEAELMLILRDAMPRHLTFSDLIYRLYGQFEPSDAVNCVQVFKARIKRKLKGTPLMIETNRLRGYRLVVLP